MLSQSGLVCFSAQNMHPFPSEPCLYELHITSGPETNPQINEIMNIQIKKKINEQLLGERIKGQIISLSLTAICKWDYGHPGSPNLMYFQ
jgi:hypothetical protein